MSHKKFPPDILAFFRAEGKKGGKKAAAKMTAKQRSERARKAVAAREARRKLGGVK